MGTKEASADLAQVGEILRTTPDTFDVYSGDDGTILPLLALGGAGVISVISHVVGPDLAALHRAWFAGEREEAARLFLRTLPITRALFCAPSPAPTKYALSLLGQPAGPVRLPSSTSPPASSALSPTRWRRTGLGVPDGALSPLPSRRARLTKRRAAGYIVNTSTMSGGGEGMSTTVTRYLQNGPLADLYDKVMEGRRLSLDDGVRLWNSDDLTAIGGLANIVREAKNGNKTYYVRNQHINYTNICNKGCRFCSFYAQKGSPAPYTLGMDDVRARLERTRHIPITEIHMVAGIHPRAPTPTISTCCAPSRRPGPTRTSRRSRWSRNLRQIQKLAGKPLAEVLRELKASGLDSLPGGGAEILTDRVHDTLFPKKETAEEWLETAKTAHRVGLPTNATMLYGHIETVEERVTHLMKLRAQDETGGFLTFIPLAFSSKGTKLAHVPPTTGYLDLKAVAIGRLMLDNFPHVKAFWMMITPPVAQAAQWYGADDVDGTIVEYEITHEIREDNARSTPAPASSR